MKTADKTPIKKESKTTLIPNVHEYNHLYQEIHSNEDKITRAIQIMVVFVVGIITYSLKKDEVYIPLESLIFLVPLVVIIPFAYFISSKIDSTKKIAAYIEIFHETDSKDSNPRWETRLSQFSEEKKSDYGFSILFIFLSISLVCFSFFLYPNLSNFNLSSLLLIIYYCLFLLLLGISRKKECTIIKNTTITVILFLLFLLLFYGGYHYIYINTLPLGQLTAHNSIAILLSFILISSLHKIYWIETQIKKEYLSYWTCMKDRESEAEQLKKQTNSTT